MSADILSRLLGTLKSTFRINKATIDTSALTVARTVTLPDASLTVAGVDVVQSFTEAQIFLNGGIKIANGAHHLVLASGDFGLTSSPTLYLSTSDGDRVLTITDDVTLPDDYASLGGDGGLSMGQVVAIQTKRRH